MELRNGKKVSLLKTNFDTGAALQQVHEEQEADGGDLSDTDGLTALFRHLEASSKTSRKRPRSDSLSLPTAPRPSAASASDSKAVPSPLPSNLPSHKQSNANKRRKFIRQKNPRAKSDQERRPTLSKTIRLIDECSGVDTPFDAQSLPSTSCGFGALPPGIKAPGPEEDLDKLINTEEYELVPWDGKTPLVILDSEERIIGICAGKPNDPTFTESCERLYQLMMEKGDELDFIDKHLHHIRGRFPAINVGVTHGKGSKTPHTLKHEGKVKEVVYNILENQNMIRVATFQSSCMRMWAPKLHHYYKKHLDRMWKPRSWNKGIELRRNFANSIYPCVALNFGGKVWATRHRDSKNLPFGLCAITALGHFDPTRGGHMVLPQLRLVIQFPPRSTILIPSATLTHCNVPVSPHESRLSFTQFCAGDLFRFVESHFKTEANLAATDPAKYAKVLEKKETRWQKGLNLFSTLTGLWEDSKRDLEGTYDDGSEDEDYDDISEDEGRDKR